VANNAVPGTDQGFRHGAAHDAETDNPDDRFHVQLFS
jgi:hypothetical protein